MVYVLIYVIVSFLLDGFMSLYTNFSIDSISYFKTIYTANFKNSKLETLIIEYENKPTKDYLDMIDDIYINYENKLKQLEAGGGYEYKLKKESNKVYFTSKINLNKIL